MSDAPPDVCGCCEEAPATPDLYNAPGQEQLRYRIGVHSSFLQRLLSRLGRQEIPDGDHAGLRPLQELTTRAEDDFAIGLMDAWAVVADVLTFYQERIANEGFLRTAGERRSLLELARAIGYELNPGVSAETYLAFTVEEDESVPDTAAIAPGTQVQSIPQEEGELPQVFETAEAFTAEVAWNALRPRLTQPQLISSSTTLLYFEGTATQLSSGDRLLFVGAEREANFDDNHWDVRRVLSVQSEPAKNRTRVTLQAGSGVRPLPADPSVYVFRQRANIFGYNAADWASLSNQVKADYLGLDSPDDLLAEDKLQWPNYLIYAPGDTLGEVLAPSRPVEATAEAVAYAAINAAEGQATSLNNAATTATMAAVLGTVDAVRMVIGEVASAGEQAPAVLSWLGAAGADDSPLVEIATSFQSILQKAQPKVDTKKWALDTDAFEDLTILTTNLPELLNQLKNAVDTLSENITSVKWLDISEIYPDLQNVLSQMERLRRQSPVLFPYSVLKRLGEALQEGETQAARTLQAAGRTVGSTAQAGAAGAIAQIMRGLLEATLPFNPSPQDVARLARFATRVAQYAAIVAAPQTLFQEFQSEFAAAEPGAGQVNLVLRKLRDEPQSLILPPELQEVQDEEELLALATVLGVAAAGAGGAALAATSAGAMGIVAMGATPLAVIGAGGALPLMGAALTPLVLGSVIVGPDVVAGARQIADTVDAAVEAALHPPAESLTARRAFWELSNNRIDLDAVYDRITPDSWAYLSGAGQEELYRITALMETARAEFLLSGKVSRLTLAGPSLQPFAEMVRQTTVFAAPEQLTLAEPDDPSPVGGLSLMLQEVVGVAPPGDQVIVAGREQNGETDLAEIATLERVEQSASGTRLVFSAALANLYRRDSVTIYGNVVRATHGETVAGEVLGGGSGAQPHQRLTLKKPPLTHVAAETPSGSQSELTVYVNGVAWEQVSSLYGLAAEDRAYVVRIDDDARATLLFGDGRMGARLPTGQENVRATYRSGIGQEGEVSAGTLTLLKTRPFGIRSVTNPLPADGSEDPEKMDDARENAPLTVRTLDRVVSLRDYEDFARAFAGIGKAQAVAIWDGARELVHITVADPTGDPVPTSTLDRLEAAIEAARDPLRSFCLGPFEKLTFSLEARVLVDEAYVRAEVEESLEETLLEAFSFAKRQFGQPVSAAELLAVMHDVAGVLAVDLDRLFVDGDPPLISPVLGARVAAYQATAPHDNVCGRILPAQMLLLNPAGITLKVMTP